MTDYDGTTFTYDARGRRTKKNDITFCYDSNGNLISQSNGLEFLYDHTGVFAVKYADSTYIYRKDAQGNIVELLDSTGATMVKYKYDAWGNCQTTVIDSTATEIATLNPFRYRSYYYDTETGFYFLKTRYYDPELGRFLTIDDLSYLDPETVNGLNLYAYCLNNAVKYADPTGQFPILALILGITALVGIGLTIGGVASDNNTLTAIGLTMVAIPALISGGMAIVAGIGGAILTGIIGGVTVTAGVGSGLFAFAEYQEAITGNNWMLDAGMSEGWYNGLMITTAAIATLGTFLSFVGYSFNIKSIDKIGKLVPSNHPSEGYMGIRFQNARGALRSLELQNHVPHGLHFQLNSWNPMHMSVKTIRRWTWFLTRM